MSCHNQVDRREIRPSEVRFPTSGTVPDGVGEAQPFPGFSESLHEAHRYPRKLQWQSPSSPGRSHSSPGRSEEHTSELQSRQYLVCRLLLEKKKKKQNTHK